MAQCMCPKCRDYSDKYRVYISDGSHDNTRWVASFDTREQAEAERANRQHKCNAFTAGEFFAYIIEPTTKDSMTNDELCICGRYVGEHDATWTHTPTTNPPSAPADTDADPWMVCNECGSDVRMSELHAIGCDVCQPSVPPETDALTRQREYCQRLIAEGEELGCPANYFIYWQDQLAFVIRKIATLSAGVLLALTLTGHHASAQPIDPTPPAGCTIVGDTGPDEGFPVAHCADGSYVYADLDGSDGALGTVGDGRWLDATAYVLHAAQR
jgi:hypothetical protein